MVGVWIEPVIAQLMMILLAIDVSFPPGAIREQRIWRMRRCQRGVISRLCRAGHNYRAATPEHDPIQPAGGLQLHIATKISPLETACIFNGFVSVAARFERRQAEPRLPDMCEVL